MVGHDSHAQRASLTVVKSSHGYSCFAVSHSRRKSAQTLLPIDKNPVFAAEGGGTVVKPVERPNARAARRRATDPCQRPADRGGGG